VGSEMCIRDRDTGQGSVQRLAAHDPLWQM